MNEPASLAPIAAGRRDEIIETARVQVVVSFPDFTLSVAEANALRAGQVVNLGVSLARAQMRVKVSGEDIGEGHLIVVDTHAAVLMMSMRS
jgi:flagellar motor switch/type III secretory pathway protein FliN